MFSEIKKQTGNGIRIFSDPNEMVERLDLLIASKNAGNHSIEVHNECVKILDKLLKMKFIKKSHHRSIFSTLSREPSVNFFKLNK
jgi:hypothetical protein